MLIDLHIHSTYSDGTLSPQELINYVKSIGIEVIALTDHDETGGIEPTQNFGKEAGVEVIPGVELSIDYSLPLRGHLHLLGLFIDPNNSALVGQLDKLKEARRERAKEIISKLNSLEIDVSYSELEEIVGEGSAGRPHFVKLLLDKKMISTPHEAFVKYLGRGCPAYVPKEKLKIEQAIEIIHQAGGLAIMAHPISLGYKTYPETGKEIQKLQALGLDGIEAYYPSHSYYFTKWLTDFAEVHVLAVSGGSDFHGATKPGIQAGSGYGNLKIPADVLNNLKQFHNKTSNNQ